MTIILLFMLSTKKFKVGPLSLTLKGVLTSKHFGAIFVDNP